jgi:hypothetical protein
MAAWRGPDCRARRRRDERLIRQREDEFAPSREVGSLPPCGGGISPFVGHVRALKHRRYSRVIRSRSALPTTLTDDSAIAAAAMIGDSSRPKAG